MSGAPPGALVALTYDWDNSPNPPSDGDVLWSSGGSVYLILSARKMRSVQPCRLALRCVKLAAIEDRPPGARVEPLVWYPRKRRRSR